MYVYQVALHERPTRSELRVHHVQSSTDLNVSTSVSIKMILVVVVIVV
jgi:hypothetical protein